MASALWAALVVAVGSPGVPSPDPSAYVVQAAAASRSTRDAPWDRLEKVELQNGMTVVLCHIEMMPVTVMASYRVGSAQDPPGKAGLAHLTAHLAYRASDDMPPGGRGRALARAHAIENNRGTDWEWTEFWTTVPSGSVATALELEAYRLEAVRRQLPGTMVDDERKAILLERGSFSDAVLDDPLDEQVMEALFPPGHPYRRPVTGTVEDLRRITPSDVEKFARTWYRASNVVVTIVGGFDPRATRGLAERLLGQAPLEPAPPAPRPPAPVVGRGTVIEQPGTQHSTRVDVAWAVPALFADGDAHSALTAWLMTVRLARRHQPEGMAGSVWHLALGTQGVLVFSLSAPPTTSTRRVLEWVEEEVRTLATVPPSEMEMREAMDLLEANFLTSYDGQAGLPEWGRILRDYATSLGNVDRLEWDLARHRRVTGADVSEFASRVLRADQRTVVLAPVLTPWPSPDR